MFRKFGQKCLFHARSAEQSEEYLSKSGQNIEPKYALFRLPALLSALRVGRVVLADEGREGQTIS